MVVDVLSFGTAVATAIARGGIVVPCAPDDDVAALAAHHGAVIARHRDEAIESGGYSLSPRSFLSIGDGDVVVLPSPNGGACSRLGAGASFLLAGALVNATAVGHLVTRLAETSEHGVTVVAAGERYDEPSEEGIMRFAVEDYLGAGAILAAIDGDKSPEAAVCESAFAQVRHRIGEVLWGCESGLELRARGSKDDVHHAAQLDRYGAVPVLVGERFVRWMPPVAKVVAYVTRRRGERTELLVFEHADHPEAGLQVPAGTIAAMEDPDVAALREVHEETGLDRRSLRVVRHLTTHTLHADWASAHHERHVYHLEHTAHAPDRWQHTVATDDTRSEDRGLRFDCRWHDITEPLELAGRQGEYLEYLLASLES